MFVFIEGNKKVLQKLKVFQWNLKSKQVLKLSSHEVHHIYYVDKVETGQNMTSSDTLLLIYNIFAIQTEYINLLWYLDHDFDH